MTVRQATYDEIPDILVVLEAARGIMRSSGNTRQWVDGYPDEQVIRADLAAGAGYVLLDSAPGGNYVPGGNHAPGSNYVPGVAPEVSKKRPDLGQGIGPSRTHKPLSAPEVPPQNVDLGHLPIPSPSAAPDPTPNPAPNPAPGPAPGPAPNPTPAPTLAPNAAVAPIPGDAIGANQGANLSTAVTPVPGATVRPDTPSNASNGSDTSSAPMGGHSTHTASSATLPGSVSSRFGRFLRPLWAALRIFLPEVSKKRPDLGQGIAPSGAQEPLSAPEVPPQNVDLGHLPTPPLSATPDPAPAPTLAPNAAVAPIPGDTIGANQGANPSAAVVPVPGANPDATHITASSSCPDPTLATSLVSSPAPGPALPAKAERIVGYFAYIPSPEPTYARIYGGAWLDDTLPYHVIHRIASLPSVHGVFAAMLDFCSAAEPNIRIDTHSDNHIMQHLLARHGFTLCGTIYLASGSPRLAYQRLLPTATHPAK